jgi:hypothetical protein
MSRPPWTRCATQCDLFDVPILSRRGHVRRQDETALQAALQLSMAGGGGGGGIVGTEVPGPGLPPDFQGNYEVFALVTHKGRFADGGHYMGWVRQEGDNWLVRVGGDALVFK